MGMPLVPEVTELIVCELIYLEQSGFDIPVYMYINSFGTVKGNQQFGHEYQAMAVYDAMSFAGVPIYTLCVGTAWGEAALLLAAGVKGERSALPSSSIMIRQPIGRFQGQATLVEQRREALRRVKNQWNEVLARHTGQTFEQIEADVTHPKYFSPSEAIEYGIIDKVYKVQRKTKPQKKEEPKELEELE